MHENTPDKGAIVEFWTDPQNEEKEEFHYFGKITEKKTDVRYKGDISYNIWVPGVDRTGRLTDEDFSAHGGTKPYEHESIPYEMVRLSNRNLKLKTCPE